MIKEKPIDRIMTAINGNMVNDAITAIDLASVLIRHRYGEEFLKVQQPLSTRDDGEFWLVDGPPNAVETKSGIGPIHIRLKKSDASVAGLFCSLSKELEKKMRSKRPSPRLKK